MQQLQNFILTVDAAIIPDLFTKIRFPAALTVVLFYIVVKLHDVRAKQLQKSEEHCKVLAENYNM
jgi:hypothetical protein